MVFKIFTPFFIFNIIAFTTYNSIYNIVSDPRTKGFSQDGKLHSDKYISVYNLVTNTEKRPVPDLFRRSLDTSFILYFLATRTAMFGAKLPEDLSVLSKNDDVTFFGGLILRHQQIIPSNIHSVHRLSILYIHNNIHRLCVCFYLLFIYFHVFRRCVDNGLLSFACFTIFLCLFIN